MLGSSGRSRSIAPAEPASISNSRLAAIRRLGSERGSSRNVLGHFAAPRPHAAVPGRSRGAVCVQAGVSVHAERRTAVFVCVCWGCWTHTSTYFKAGAKCYLNKTPLVIF